MSEIEFSYQQKNTIIQCNLNEKMYTICLRFVTKSRLDINDVYFLYHGKKLNFELTFEQTISSYDKNLNKMKILVYSINDTNINKNNITIKSSDIICPECQEIAKINIKDYFVNLCGCKKGHKLYNMPLNEFEITQNIDISKITCCICKENNKSNIYKNEFYRCNTCHINLCPLCKSRHDNKHYILNYDDKNYFCNKHNEPHIMYCKDCKLNICLSCQNQHKNHNYIFYRNIMPDIDKIKNEMNILKKTIDNFKNNINKIIKCLTKVMMNIEIYHKIYNDIINNYESKNRTFELMQSLNEMDNTFIINDLNKINQDDNIINQFKNILVIYNKMLNNNKNESFKDNKHNEIKLRVEIDKNSINKEIYFLDNTNGSYSFGTHYHDFLKELNESNVELYINNIKYKYKKFFIPKEEGIYLINIRFNTYLKDCSHMFHGCSKIREIDLTLFNSNQTTNMGFMFGGCEKLENIINLKNLRTHNVTNKQSMFSGTKLNNINLSFFNTINVNNMSQMFYSCNNLKELDLSSFNTTNLINIEYMFGYCHNLKTINLSSFYTNNDINSKFIFEGCHKLENLKINHSLYEKIKKQNNIKAQIEFI